MNSKLRKDLSDLGFFDEEILREQLSLVSSVSSRRYQPGDVIYRNGEDSRYLCVLSSGMVKLVAYMPSGRTRIVRLHKRGSLIGLDGLMGEDHGHTAIAVSQVAAYQIPHSELVNWREHEPHLYAQLLEKWYAYLNYADTWITEFSTGSVRGRVARLILFLASFDDETGPLIVELLTTDEMSEVLGVTPESVSRIVSELKRDGILVAIENNAESLFTYDRNRLEQDAGS